MRYHWGLGVGHVGMGSQIDSASGSSAPSQAQEDIPILPEVQSLDSLPQDLPTEEQDSGDQQDKGKQQDKGDQQDNSDDEQDDEQDSGDEQDNSNDYEDHQNCENEDDIPNSNKHGDALYDMFGDDDDEDVGSYD